MKKLLIIFTCITFLQVQPAIEDGSKEIDTITSVFSEEGYTVNEWQTIMIDKISKRKFQHIIKKLETSYLATVIKDDNKLKYIVETKNSTDYMNYSFQIIVPNDLNDEITIQTIVSGDRWDESVRDYYKNLTKHLQSDYSLKFNKIFTCVKLDDNGIIINGFSNDKIWEKMNVVHKSEHYDNVKQSIYEKEVYGHTPLWNSKVIVQEEPINFHMIIKKEEAINNNQVIIGTPIILNEY